MKRSNRLVLALGLPADDVDLSLWLRSPQDATSADATTTGVTLRQLVDEHGVLPPRVVLTKLP